MTAAVNSTQHIPTSDPIGSMAYITIKVKPNARDECVDVKGSDIVVYTKEKPEKGRANAAVERLLKKLLKRNVRIIKGAKSRTKVLEVEGDESEIIESIRKEADAKKTKKNH